MAGEVRHCSNLTCPASLSGNVGSTAPPIAFVGQQLLQVDALYRTGFLGGLERLNCLGVARVRVQGDRRDHAVGELDERICIGSVVAARSPDGLVSESGVDTVGGEDHQRVGGAGSDDAVSHSAQPRSMRNADHYQHSPALLVAALPTGRPSAEAGGLAPQRPKVQRSRALGSDPSPA